MLVCLAFFSTHSRLIVTDVGGGSAHIRAKYSISYISLRWMIEELVEAGYRHLFPTDPQLINESLHSLILPSPEQCPATPQDAMVQDLLDLDNFKQKMNNRKWVPLLKGALNIADHRTAFSNADESCQLTPCFTEVFRRS
jgi:hypothetical protein